MPRFAPAPSPVQWLKDQTRHQIFRFTLPQPPRDICEYDVFSFRIEIIMMIACICIRLQSFLNERFKPHYNMTPIISIIERDSLCPHLSIPTLLMYVSDSLRRTGDSYGIEHASRFVCFLIRMCPSKLTCTSSDL